MNRIKILMIIMISFGFFASPAIAACILPDTDFFYGITAENQSEIILSDAQLKSLKTEVGFKEKKGAATLPDDILNPENFYGYTD
ncbi:MAG: hypothetical protein HF978_20000 [Desulfobacteraceae bacterium]|nr:hypothetical protein [Desulfobacteraceae bacterium]MBC2757830.1 hypothetical protein [Desulfobacteraceae bacterium]